MKLKNISKIIGIGGIALVMVGCTTSSPNAPIQMDRAAKKFKTTPGKSNIYIYRNEMYGGFAGVALTLDGKPIGATQAKTYIKVTTNPGQHTLTSKAEVDHAIQLKTKANKNYFVWQEIKMGVVTARSKLKAVSEQEGKKGVKECTLVQSIK